MMVLFDGLIEVSYGFAWLRADDDHDGEIDIVHARGGQQNGLLGAAHRNVLGLVMGLHTGAVPLRVEVQDTEPAVGAEWEDVVEVSYEAPGGPLVITAFQDSYPLAEVSAGHHRTRLSAAGMDAAHDRSRTADEPVIDRYLLQLWPADPRPDVVLRCSSQIAGYWHSVARDTPRPPTRPTPDQRVAQEAENARTRILRQQADELEWEERSWGGRLPSARLRDVSHLARQICEVDRDLVDRLMQLEASDQREFARQIARWTCGYVGVLDRDWVVEVLAALQAGEPAGALLDRAERRVFGDPVDRFAVGWTSYDLPEPLPLDPEVVALGALRSADRSDPAAAAIDGLAGSVTALHQETTTLRVAWDIADRMTR